MSTLQYAIERNGKWLKDAIEILADMPPTDVLGAIYSLPTIEEYVAVKKKGYKAEITKILQGQYEWLESGELVIFDIDFFDYYLDFKGDAVAFAKYIRGPKITTAELGRYHKKLVTNAEFRHYNNQH